MAAKRPTDTLRKVEAVKADRSATSGEKAAAEAAANRIRVRLKRERAEKEKAAIKEGGTMYLLGRAINRARSGSAADDPKPTGKGVMFALGKALRKAAKKK
jgi:hypothetical protein